MTPRLKFEWFLPFATTFYRPDEEQGGWRVDLLGVPHLFARAPELEDARNILRVLALRHVADLLEVYGSHEEIASLANLPDASSLPCLYIGWSLPISVQKLPNGPAEACCPLLPIPKTKGPNYPQAVHAFQVAFLRYLADLYLRGETPPAQVLQDPEIFLEPPEQILVAPDPFRPFFPESLDQKTVLDQVTLNIPAEDGTLASAARFLLRLASDESRWGDEIPAFPGTLVFRSVIPFKLQLTQTAQDAWSALSPDLPLPPVSAPTEFLARRAFVASLLRFAAERIRDGVVPHTLRDMPPMPILRID